MTTTATPAQTPTGVLGALREAQAAVADAELRKVHHTLEWALAHEVGELDDAMFLAGHGVHGLTLAGRGAPLVAEPAVVELAAALGASTDAGASWVGDCLEIRYRLPRLWERVAAGTCPVWRARRIAQSTVHLCQAGADHVDRHVAAFAHRVSWAQLDRLVAEALLRWEPEVAEGRRRAAAEQRHVTIRTREVGPSGVVDLDASLDLADALDLDAALSERAAVLRELGCEESLDVRRSLALGDLARSQPTLDLDGAGDDAGPRPLGRSGVRTAAGRVVRLHVHVSDAAVTGAGDDLGRHGVARVRESGSPLLAEQVRAWCGGAARIVVTPVLDLAETVHVDSYETSERQRRQAEERDRTCVFPWCTRPAHRCDLDHRVAWAEGGVTASDNLAPLCRRHHRMKTHHGWSYETPVPAVHLWRSPAGARYLRTSAGTSDLDRSPPSGAGPRR